MKKYFLLLLVVFTCTTGRSQQLSIAADKMNVLYVGIDNPLTIAVENNSGKTLFVKTTIGTISGVNGKYVFRSDAVGGCEIIVYKRSNNKLVRIGSNFFRVKALPAPVFKIGSGKSVVTKAELVNQQFVRAELEGFDFDAKFRVDSFTVCIIPNDTCSYGVVKNSGNKINTEIHNEFSRLKPGDVLVFKNIFASRPDETTVELMPVMIKIKN